MHGKAQGPSEEHSLPATCCGDWPAAALVRYRRSTPACTRTCITKNRAKTTLNEHFSFELWGARRRFGHSVRRAFFHSPTHDKECGGYVRTYTIPQTPLEFPPATRT